jgi:hypothetical protein
MFEPSDEVAFAAVNWPRAGSTRLSLIRGAFTSIAPALVSTSRGW